MSFYTAVYAIPEVFFIILCEFLSLCSQQSELPTARNVHFCLVLELAFCILFSM